MVIVKLADGSLWVNSPVSVPTEVLDHIKASGPVRYLVAPTKLHIWRLEEWHALFPEAELWIRSFEKLLLWDFDKLIIAHGVCIEIGTSGDHLRKSI
jgi:hypothetical protein